MASIYKRKRSPYYWIRWKDGINGKQIYESTKIRIDDPEGKTKAKMLRLQMEIKEEERKVVSNNGNFKNWLLNFINIRYEPGSRTYEQRMHDYRLFLTFFDMNDVYHPIHVTRDLCFKFVQWRRQQVHINTTRREVRFLSTVMREAVKRGFCKMNPATDLGIKGVEPKPKKEVTPEEFQKIREEIQTRLNSGAKHAQFFHGSFEVATCQGVRLSETRIHLVNDVDLQNNSISFHGKGDRYWTTSLNPRLKEKIIQWKEQGLEWSYDPDFQQRDKSYMWRRLLNRLNMRHISFHCFRVTFISQMERSGVQETVVMQLVNHSSTTVHRVYRRHSGSEIDQTWKKLDDNLNS